MRAKKALALHGESGLILQLDIDIGARLKNGLIENGNRTHGVIHGVVYILDKRSSSGGNRNTSAGDIHGVEPYLAAAGTLVLTRKVELILLGVLLCRDERGIVEFLIDILVGYDVAAYLLAQVRTERLQYGEDNASVGGIDRQPLYIVELAVGVRILLLVESVEVHHPEQRFALDCPFCNVLHICTDRVVAVGYIEFELIGRDTRCAEGIDVLHHQIPCTRILDIGSVVGGLQEFQNQRIRGTEVVARIGGELTYLVDLSVVGVLIGYGEDLILVKGGLERDETEGGIECVLRRREQAGRLDLLVILTTIHIVIAVQHRGHLLNIAYTERANRII